jgi:hypothetical protein
VTTLVAARLMPWLRRRRRMRGPPHARVLGAWAQAEERLRRAGGLTTGTLTASEVATAGRERLGADAGEALLVLARLYNESAYASRSGPAAEARAALAWRSCREVEAAVRRARRARGAGRGRRAAGGHGGRDDGTAARGPGGSPGPEGSGRIAGLAGPRRTAARR